MSHPRDASTHAVSGTTIAPLHRRSFTNRNRNILSFDEKEGKGAEIRSPRHRCPMPNDAVRSPRNPIYTGQAAYRIMAGSKLSEESPLQRCDFVPPRDLTERERDVLTFLTSLSFPGNGELQKQVQWAKVDYGYVDEATISLVVDRSVAPPAEVQERVLAIAVGTERDWQRCFVNLFVIDDYLSMLELACSLDYEPPEFPPVYVLARGE